MDSKPGPVIVLSGDSPEGDQCRQFPLWLIFNHGLWMTFGEQAAWSSCWYLESLALGALVSRGWDSVSVQQRIEGQGTEMAREPQFYYKSDSNRDL